MNQVVQIWLGGAVVRLGDTSSRRALTGGRPGAGGWRDGLGEVRQSAFQGTPASGRRLNDSALSQGPTPCMAGRERSLQIVTRQEEQQESAEQPSSAKALGALPVVCATTLLFVDSLRGASACGVVCAWVPLS